MNNLPFPHNFIGDTQNRVSVQTVTLNGILFTVERYITGKLEYYKIVADGTATSTGNFTLNFAVSTAWSMGGLNAQEPILDTANSVQGSIGIEKGGVDYVSVTIRHINTKAYRVVKTIFLISNGE